MSRRLTSKRLLGAFGLALAIGAAPFASAAATELKLFHTWSNESEIGALNAIVKAFEAKGNKITEMAVPHEQAGSSPLVSLIVAGTPPNLFINSEPGLYRDLTKRGLGEPLDAYFDKIGATPNFPETVLKSIKVDGEIRKIPTGVHIDGMIYYNKKVAAEAGVDPTKWASLDDMFADMKKVQQAGFTFIGVGGNTFQAGYLFHALVAAVAGPDIYNRFYGETPDKTVFDEKGLRDAIDMFRKITSQGRRGLGEPAMERDDQHGHFGQDAHADPWRLDEGSVEGQQEGARRGFRLHQHSRHQGAIGDGGCVRHPRRPAR
ncbi:ABC transporter substrate-binding protein [Mesorhizobium sp. M0142]|uniref:ABC transporter substrate-binding protein n=1 Tax=Mesorhizobium sp. M0142 TaxID=2956894 RepID=UPI003338A0BF